MQLLERLEIENLEMRSQIYKKIGGNPQFLEFSVKLMINRPTEKLLEDVAPVREKTGEWLLNELIELLSEEERDALKKMSVFRLKVDRSAFNMLRISDGVVDKLVYYSLVEFD